MCEISENVRLCTCSEKDLKTAKNTWALSRAKTVPDLGEEVIVGLYLPSRLSDSETEKINVDRLAKTLNAGNCFDVPIMLHDGDEITFYFEQAEKSEAQIIYCFIYNNAHWENVPYYPFGSKRNIEAEGCLR